LGPGEAIAPRDRSERTATAKLRRAQSSEAAEGIRTLEVKIRGPATRVEPDLDRKVEVEVEEDQRELEIELTW